MKRTLGRRCLQTDRFADTMRGVVALGGGSGSLNRGGFGFPSSSSAFAATGSAGGSPSLPWLPSRRLGISTDRRRPPLPEGEAVGDTDACSNDVGFNL